MGKVLIAAIFLLIGIAIGGAGGTLFLGGGMMGVGVATGLTGGVCGAVEAGQQLGYLTAEQADEVIARTWSSVSGAVGVGDAETAPGGAEECGRALDRLREAAAGG